MAASWLTGGTVLSLVEVGGGCCQSPSMQADAVTLLAMGMSAKLRVRVDPMSTANRHARLNRAQFWRFCARTLQTLYVKVVEGRGLMASDLSGRSDPYVKLCLTGRCAPLRVFSAESLFFLLRFR